MTTSEGISLVDEYVIDAVDHRGLSAGRSNTGRWRAAWFIIGVEVAERFAYYGIGSNLISYLTGPLGQSTAVAAANVNAWSGVGSLLPVLGAFVADAFLGRYRTIIIASLIYVLGLALLTFSAFLVPITTEVTSSPSSVVNVLFFFSLYLVAIGQSGHKPCVQAFGADQFDEKHAQEKSDRGSFFNWWYLSMCAGVSLAFLVVVYIQENLSWALGFGLPCVFMVISLLIFVFGKKSYRYARRRTEEEINPFTRIGRVFFEAFRNHGFSSSQLCKFELETNVSPERLRFLNKTLLSPNATTKGGINECSSASDVEDATALVKLIPIWITTLAYAIPYAQSMTFFTAQGITMERTIVPGVKIPAASLHVLVGISVVLFVPIYDRVLIPIARFVTKDPCGITTLKRIGTGMVLVTLTMVVAALVETKRLETAKEHGLIDQPKTTVPMSIWWLIPQYLLLGLADVHTLVGMQEFFYSQVPTELRSIGLALYLSALGVGSLLSSLLVSVIDLATGGDAGNSWFNSNLNRAHLDYFYWLLTVISAVGFSTFLFFSKSYMYRRVV